MNSFISSIRSHWLMAILVIFNVYFLLAALQGDSGLYRYFQINAQIAQVTTERDALVEEREKLSNLTLRLSDDYLDLDLLDEQARKRLGLVRGDEIIIK